MMGYANTKFKTEKRKANVGERILITDAEFTFGDYDNGDVFTVIGIHRGLVENGVNVKMGDFPQIYDSEYEVIIDNPKPSKSERISLLESQVAELQAKVEALEKPKETTVNNVTITSPTINSYDDLARLLDRMPKMPTPNEQRKAVIERAKDFVGRQQALTGRRVEYVVNADKRTVVALIYRIAFRGERNGLYAKAIAKCAPDDVFNADIGKAIALGRALGLDVGEFENAVKPTERVCGMTVLVSGEKYGRKLAKQYDGTYFTTGLNSFNAKRSVIIDDTEAQY